MNIELKDKGRVVWEGRSHGLIFRVAEQEGYSRVFRWSIEVEPISYASISKDFCGAVMDMEENLQRILRDSSIQHELAVRTGELNTLSRDVREGRRINFA